MSNLPSYDTIASVYAEKGSIRQTAETLGYAESTVRGWAKRDSKIEAIFTDQVEESLLAARDSEVRDLRRNKKKLLEQLGKREEWLGEVLDAARQPVREPHYAQSKEYAAKAGKRPVRSIVLPIFDLQYGQNVIPKDTPFGKGGFNPEIFDIRLEMYLQKVEAYLSKMVSTVDFKEITFILGGDLVEGDKIFAGQAWQLALHPVKQVLEIKTKLGVALRRLIGFAKERLGVHRVIVLAIPGNHGKVGGKQSGAIPADYSWDYMASALLFDELRCEPIDVQANVAGGCLLFETEGHTFLVIHGDEIKGTLGVPFYGINKADGRFIRMSEHIHDYCLMGHHHQPAVVPNGSGGSTIVSGDWVGANNLSRVIMAASRPEQKVLIVSAKHGLVEEARIYLDGDDHRDRKGAFVYNAR